MKSIKEIFKMGFGPSSSHTMGPSRIGEMFLDKYPHTAHAQITLFGSLALTGKGHLTDLAIEKIFSQVSCTINWQPEIFLPKHPNGMQIIGYDKSKKKIGQFDAYSIGGGDITIDQLPPCAKEQVYTFASMDDILEIINNSGKSFWELVKEHEDKDIEEYIHHVWQTMEESIQQGIEEEGVLPGPLTIRRKASSYYIRAINSHNLIQMESLTFAYALAVAEENASGGRVVTAPTCGSSGVLPATIKILKDTYNLSDKKIIRSLMTAGMIGNIVKKNASISGAEVGCQGEIGVACAMAAAAASQLLGGTITQIEYAAEMGLEHHLGLTCDPVLGFVQIPCIERNAMAAVRAIDCAVFALISDGTHRISFDEVVTTMAQTGKDLANQYKETSLGGLAKNYNNSETLKQKKCNT